MCLPTEWGCESGAWWGCVFQQFQLRLYCIFIFSVGRWGLGFCLSCYASCRLRIFLVERVLHFNFLCCIGLSSNFCLSCFVVPWSYFGRDGWRAGLCFWGVSLSHPNCRVCIVLFSKPGSMEQRQLFDQPWSRNRARRRASSLPVVRPTQSRRRRSSRTRLLHCLRLQTGSKVLLGRMLSADECAKQYRLFDDANASNIEICNKTRDLMLESIQRCEGPSPRQLGALLKWMFSPLERACWRSKFEATMQHEDGNAARAFQDLRSKGGAKTQRLALHVVPSSVQARHGISSWQDHALTGVHGFFKTQSKET